MPRIMGISVLANALPARYEQHFAFMFPSENLFFERKTLKT
jgi:hypothetical protein